MLECPVSVVPTGMSVAAELPTGMVVPASGRAAVGLHPRRQVACVLFPDQAVDQQGVAVITDQGRGARRPGGGAYRVLETRHRARDGPGVYREHVKGKGHDTILIRGTAARHPQVDCSQVADARIRGSDAPTLER